MIESLALSVVKSLAALLFKAYIVATPNVAIDGAPSWYYVEERSKVCVFTSAKSEHEAVEQVRTGAVRKMENRIAELLDIVIQGEYRDITSDEEKDFLLALTKDRDLPLFVRGNIRHEQIEYDEESGRTFGKSCIDKALILDYETKRIAEAKTALTHKRAEDAFDELDAE
ncbi:hypothetical protein [Limisalsivibrio acetivorans]|uniref:hypothetical protein n=1 Tax=Limisalsivibrio acetivorans TaxID=1304888 RepID=UPI0003B57FA1|nr:hypothetical protein [Limisalsivibrio acetivorans]